jgi:enterochelin esterase family protein
VLSPEVAADRRVTFRLRAPEAKTVVVGLDGVPPLPMTKGEDGVWSVATQPLEPDFHPYVFIVDDAVRIADPSNPLTKVVLPSGHQSLAHVPGPASLPWEWSDVPRGTVHRHFYRSLLAGEDRDFYVYTPPGYETDGGKTAYPVLYLFHGLTDDASAWTTAGRAHVILDNLIAQGRAKPMIVVNPLGYALPGGMRRPDPLDFLGLPATKAFAATLLEEVMPQVERAYRVGRDRESRAVAGLSMGGGHALYVGLGERERFAWVASFSGAPPGGGHAPGETPGFDAPFPNLTAAANEQRRLLWIACGTDDFLFGANRQFKDWLKAKEIAFTDVETPGQHTWAVWKRNLAELLPLLFR